MLWEFKGTAQPPIDLALRLLGLARTDWHANSKGLHLCDLILGLPKVADRQVMKSLVFCRSSIKKFM